MTSLAPPTSKLAPFLCYALSAAAHIAVIAGGAFLVPTVARDAYPVEVPKKDVASMFRVSAEVTEAPSKGAISTRSEAETKVAPQSGERDPDKPKAEEDQQDETTAIGWDPHGEREPGATMWPSLSETRHPGPWGDPGFYPDIGTGAGRPDSTLQFATRKAVKNEEQVAVNQDGSSETNGVSRQTRRKVCPPSVPGVATFCEWRPVEVVR